MIILCWFSFVHFWSPLFSIVTYKVIEIDLNEERIVWGSPCASGVHLIVLRNFLRPVLLQTVEMLVILSLHKEKYLDSSSALLALMHHVQYYCWLSPKLQAYTWDSCVPLSLAHFKYWYTRVSPLFKHFYSYCFPFLLIEYPHMASKSWAFCLFLNMDVLLIHRLFPMLLP